MSWSTIHDFDMYARHEGSFLTCYYGRKSVSYDQCTLNLNVDAHSGCNETDGPEIITLTGEDAVTFLVWYNRYSSCNVPPEPDLPTFDIQITNYGLEAISVYYNSLLLSVIDPSETTEWLPVVNPSYAGSGTGLSDYYADGTPLEVVLGVYDSSSDTSVSSLSSTSFGITSLSTISSSSTSESSESSESSQSSESSESSESSVKLRDIGIAYWQIFQWPKVFIVGWTPPDSSSTSESSLSTGPFDFEYSASGFTILTTNGCYGRMGTWENDRPVFSNGTYYLKYGGDSYPRWYFQQIASLAIHYWSDITVGEPTNSGLRYTSQVGLGIGGFVEEGCPSSSSDTSISELSGLSSFSSASSRSSYSSQSSSSSRGFSSSSSSYIKNLPVELASYVSTCIGVSSVSNPATGAGVGMVVDGCLREDRFPEDDTMVYKGGLTRTSSNMGRIRCPDASRLFSMRYGMVSVTLRMPQAILNGVYEPLHGRDDSANPDMVIFSVNPGECYVSPPGLYAALTPSGIEFTVWSLGNKVTIVDAFTNAEAGEDVTMSFAWDYSRRIVDNGDRMSMVIIVNGEVTASSPDPIVPGGFGSLFRFEGDSSESTEEWATAPFYLGDSPSGKNGLVDIAIRRIEIYKEPYGIDKESTPSMAVLDPYPPSRSEIELGFSVTGAKWIGVKVGEPEFRPTVSEQINLLDIGTGMSYSRYGVDAGKLEDESYPEVPTGLPIGVKEVKGR